MFRLAPRAVLQHAFKRPRLSAYQSTNAILPDFLDNLVPSTPAVSPQGAPVEPDLPPSPADDAFPKAPGRRQATRMQTESAGLNHVLYRVTFTTTPCNTHAIIADADGNPIKQGRATGGTCKFKKAARNTYEAGYQVTMAIFRRLEEEMRLKEPGQHVVWELVLKEFGHGRRALFAALVAMEGETVRPRLQRVTDKTAIKIGGTRSQKAKRN